MKTKLLKIMIIVVLLCLVSFSNFSIANTLLMQSPLERSFSWFSSNWMCPFLTTPYLAKDGRLKPMALASLPRI